MLPVSSRMGFGAWQAVASAEGSLMKLRTTLQKSVPLLSPCWKSNAPGPALAWLRSIMHCAEDTTSLKQNTPTGKPESLS